MHLAENGATHEVGILRLGATIDSEANGANSTGSDAEGADDDGVTFGQIRVGALGTTASVTVTGAPSGAKLDAWIDFNGDGNWGGLGEQIAAMLAVVDGINAISFDVPSDAVSGTTFARFRLSTTGSLGITGPAADGEVEDYAVTIADPAFGSGTFRNFQSLSTSNSYRDLIDADLDGDGDMDLIASESGVTIWFDNNGSQSFVARTIAAVGSFETKVVDLDRDGDNDLVAALSSTLVWFENNGSQSFTSRLIANTAARSLNVADIEGDGDLDVLVATDGTLAWYGNAGNGSFSLHSVSQLKVDTVIDAVCAWDLDRDGDLDIVSGSSASQISGADRKISWYENNGQLSFTEHVVTSAYGSEIYVADLDRDGDPDLVTSIDGDGIGVGALQVQLAWLENDGSQQFTTRAITPVSTSPDFNGGYDEIFAADFDLDGDLDVSAVNGNLAVFWNDGSLQFTRQAFTTGVGQRTFDMALMDLDRDGDLDLAMASSSGGGLRWYPQNNRPTITQNSFSVNEGGTVTLTAANLNATDSDDSPTVLRYTVSNVTAGRFALSSAPTIPITSFTQTQVNSGAVQFVHDGGEAAPSYAISVSDGSAGSAATSPSISFTNVNDAPTIVANSLNISEGGTAILGHADLNATDSDNAPADLIYTTIGTTGGRFELVAAAGISITSFTQAQIDAGAVQFVHDGGEAAPSYSLSVSDGEFVSTASAATISFASVNDGPQLILNTFFLSEGSAAFLGTDKVRAIDPDNAPDELIFTVAFVEGGEFRLRSNSLVAVTTFTQAQIDAGELFFKHDGGEWAPVFSLSVSDGSQTAASGFFFIQFFNDNDTPEITANSLSIQEGGTSILSSGNLNAADPDNSRDQLVFTASGVTGGQFEFVAAPGTAISSFTQAQVDAGEVQFAHDGGEAAAGYSLRVRDFGIFSYPSTPAITFTNVNDGPIIATNSIAISEGGAVTLGSGDLLAADPDNSPSQLEFTVTDVSGGQFELGTAPGIAIQGFTQSQIDAGEIVFIHDGNEAAPAYSLTVSDGSIASTSSTATILFSQVNDAPRITTNVFAISEGGAVVLNSGNLVSADSDSTPLQLTYSVSGLSGGQFELVASPGVSISSFTQAQVNAGAVRFVHGGGEAAPSYSLIVSDGAIASAPSAPIVSFTNVNDSPTIAVNALTITEGATAVLSAVNILAADPDNSAAQLTYTVSTLTGGQFERVSAPGVAITTFTQADINTGAIRFVHNGGELAPSFALTVSDGLATTAPQTTSGGAFFNVNDNAPIFSSSPSLTLSENGTSVGNVTASDADLPGQLVTYRISGGADAAKFVLTSGGALSFVSAPDFESPTDAGGNNVYEVQVTADDGSGLTTTQNFAITVTDIADGVSSGVSLQAGVLRIIGTSGDDVVGVVRLFSYYIVATTMQPWLTTFRVSDVDRIEVSLGDGCDIGIIGPLVDVPAVLDGGNGNDLLAGAGGDTRLIGGAGDDELWAGCANNTIDAGNGNDYVYGGDGNDTILGGDGNDVIDGAGGNDLIDAGKGNDRVDGGSGNDLIRGGDGNDCLEAGSGADVVLGGFGNDTLSGGAGRDLLIGGGGSDQVLGEGDDDILIGGTTAHDSSDSALLSILAEWNSSRSYSARVANIRGTGTGTRLNGTSYLTASLVVSDSAQDSLVGSGGQDWYWSVTGQDQVSGKSSNETVN